MKKAKIISILSLLLLPAFVYASDGSEPLDSIIFLIFIEAFITPHVSLFVLSPLTKIISPANSKKLFWELFIARIIILLIGNLINPLIFAIDFIGLFIGAFLVVPLATAINAIVRKGKTPLQAANTDIQKEAYAASTNTQTVTANNPNNKCIKCGYEYPEEDKFCPNCGQPKDANAATPPKKIVTPGNFDKIYNLSENLLLQEFIKRELEKNNIAIDNKLMPEDVLKRKTVLSVILAIILYLYISAIFFHFPLLTYVVGLVLIIIFVITTNKYNLIKYLMKQVKARPTEKISNIVLSTTNSLVEDNKKNVRFVYTIIAIIIPLIMFYNPKIMYEKQDYGYAVRYYCFGLSNFKTATIPQEYKGKPVISLRGNAFSNMPFLKEVNLPDTITEIRGQAFKNDFSLTQVNIPAYLEYLGGGSFYNCSNIESIYLPDTLTYMGGETFYNASSLKEIHLSEKLPEIRGDTFEYCTSLTEITIPDSVTRIGGHAFYGDSSLNTVNISENSKLREIGSSAFRKCYNLTTIKVPQNIYINERAFKESPTNIYYHGQDYTENNGYNYYGDYYE